MAVNKKSRVFLIIAIALAAVVVAVGLLVWPMKLGQKIFQQDPAWYAIHLTNGVVYVGKIKSVNSETVVLTRSYYMQSYGAASNTEGQPAQFYGLVKQGTEAPILSNQVMYINRPVVLFWEKLEAGSDVVQKLNQHN